VARYIHNKSVDQKTYSGIVIDPGSFYQIPDNLIFEFTTSDQLLSDIANGISAISSNGTSDISGISQQIDFLKNGFVEPRNSDGTAIHSTNAFSSKTVGTKKLYKRVMGSQHSLNVGSNNIIIPITYNWAKITGIEIINSEIGDSVSFMVLDTPAGSYSGVPDLQLNQFGFSVALPKDYYHSSSEYDADLYLAMQIKIVLSSISSKTVGINLILNEVK